MSWFLTFKRQNFFFIIGIIAIYSCSQSGHNKDTDIAKDSIPSSSDIKNAETDSFKLFLNDFVKDSVFEHASIAYRILDATTDSLVAEFNPNLTLVPASTIKILTTGAALEILGANTGFRTSLQYEGKIENRILQGNLIIKGGGDPTFGISAVNKEKFFERWVRAVKDLKIDSISGYIIGDGSIFDKDITPYTWSWGEINLGYCAAASGLSIYGNIFQLGFDPDTKGTQKPKEEKMSPFVPKIKFDNRAIRNAIDEEDLYIIGLPYGDNFSIRGVVPRTKREAVLEGAIGNPPFVAANEFWKALSKAGIRCGRGAISLSENDSLQKSMEKKERKNINSVGSPSVAAIVNTTNMISYNFFAEALLKHCGLKKFGYGSTESGAKAVYEFWKDKGLNLNGMFIYDGSGISRYNGITVKQLSEALKMMKSSSDFSIFFKSLSVVGQTGTLRKMCVKSPAEGRIFAKSGTMSRVKSYAGYVKTLKGKELIFAVILNNFSCSNLEIKEKMEMFFNEMVKK